MTAVTAERVGNRIHVKDTVKQRLSRDEFDRRLAKSKSVMGCRWSPRANAWTYPLDLEICRDLRDVWGNDLVVGPELSAWAWGERDREEALNAAREMGGDAYAEVELAIVPQLAPFMWKSMQQRPYQAVAAQYIAHARESLCADQPGIGKTIEALAGLIEGGIHHGHVLILAPRTSTIVVWEREIHRWLAGYKHGATTTLLTGLNGEKAEELVEEYMTYDEPGLHFLIANAEFVRIDRSMFCPDEICTGDEDWCPSKDKHVKTADGVRQPILFEMLWDAIIADETHKWLINTRGKKASQVGIGFGKLKTQDGGMRIALTGTPLKGKRENLFGTLNWLRPKVYTSKWRWVEEHFVVFKNNWGGRIIGDMMNEAKFYRRLDSIMIRRTKSELHKINPKWMAPDKVYHDVMIPCEGKQRGLYDMMMRDAEITDEDGQYLSATGILAEMTRLKQMAQSYGRTDGNTFYPTLPSNKFDWLLEFLEARGIAVRVGRQKRGDLSDDVHKIVIASQFTKLINMYAKEFERLGISTYRITGETKERDATRIVEAWADPKDPTRVCLINTLAGGVSITLDAADDIVIHDETWVPDESEQAEDRCHRASRVDHQLDVWYLRSEGTMEGNIAEANKDKAENNHVVLDAKRGLEFARENWSK